MPAARALLLLLALTLQAQAFQETDLAEAGRLVELALGARAIAGALVEQATVAREKPAVQAAAEARAAEALLTKL